MSCVTLVKLFVFAFLLVPCISTEKMSQDLSAQFSSNSARFSLELYNILSNENEGKNLIFSPFSIQTCVALAFAGAKDDTAKEIAAGLKLVANDRALVGASFKQALEQYANSSVLKIANKMYVMSGYKIKAEFNQIAKESFFSSGEEINFAASADAANTINKWVEAKTNEKIKDLISADSLDSLTRLVLVNAIHFKGEWENKFQAERTEEEDFYINEVDSVKVQMMNGKAKYKYGYFEDLDCSALEMPYRDSDLSMLVLLPNSRTGLKDLEQKLKNVNLLDLANNMRKEEVIVKFPKFKVEFSTELNAPLKKMGIIKMFSNNAELGNLLESPEPLKVSKVIHKAFIEVNEEGAEAAAATACVVRLKRSLHVIKRNELIADHPFIYALIDGRSSLSVVLFYGAYVHPDHTAKKDREEL